MREVSEFLSRHPDMGPDFQAFASQYQTLAEVWANCASSEWMLWILYKCKYRNAVKLESYAEWLREQIRQEPDEELREMLLSDFEQYKAYSPERIKKEVESGEIREVDGRYSRFIGAWSWAHHGSEFVLLRKVENARWRHVEQEMLRALKGEEARVPQIDKFKVWADEMKVQADKLREVIGNPFAPERTEDFYYGRGQIG